jgi:GDP-L-fucose synthase
MSVLVTGGTGLVGSAIREFKPDWIYLSSFDCSLSDYNAVKNTFNIHKPDVIIHLAANVGGLFKNESQRLEMFNTNLIMNYNVLENAFRAGIKRVICCLSTCIFPDGLNRPLTEGDLHVGEPHVSNYGYAYAKRIMEVQCRLYNENPGYNYQCIVPTNIYGPHDNFHLQNSHVIPGLIHKAFLFAEENKHRISEGPMYIMGTGLPKRQFIYSKDLAKIIIRLVDEKKYNHVLICSTPQSDETTIHHVSKLIAHEFGIQNVVPREVSSVANDGQYMKTADPSLLLSIFPDLVFTPLSEGIRETVDWFKSNYPNIRK